MENFEPNKFEQNTHPYTIKRLSPSIGAELLDLDLKKPLTDSLKDEIYQALLAVSYTHLTLPTNREV